MDITKQQWWNESYNRGSWRFLAGLAQVPRYAVMASYVQTFANGGSILDLGCGEGLLCSCLDENTFVRYVGVDWSDAAVNVARHKLGARKKSMFLLGAIEDRPTTGLFDCIVFNEVLYCLNSPLEALEQYMASLVPGGVAIISMFCGESATSRRKIRDIWRGIDQLQVTILTQVSLRVATDAHWNIRVVSPTVGDFSGGGGFS